MSGLIQQLIAAGELVLFHDYRSGSFRDWSENGNDGVPTAPLAWGGKGWHSPSTGVLSIADAPELQLTSLSLVALGEFKNYTGINGQFLISKWDGGGANYSWYLQTATDRMRFYDGAITRSFNLTFDGCHCLGVTCASGTVVPKAYAEGQYLGDFDAAVTLSANDAPLLIGNNQASNYPCVSRLFAAMMVNRVLTATEMATVYSELVENGGPS